MKFQLLHFRIQLIPSLFALLLYGGAVAASDQQKMVIDIETDTIQIDQLDITHLTAGDTETIYTDDGRTIDILRKDQGVAVFVDGEPLLTPDMLHADQAADGGHKHKMMIRIECESDIECAEHHLPNGAEWTGDDPHAAHDVIVIKQSTGEEDEI